MNLHLYFLSKRLQIAIDTCLVLLYGPETRCRLPQRVLFLLGLNVHMMIRLLILHEGKETCLLRGTLSALYDWFQFDAFAMREAEMIEVAHGALVSLRNGGLVWWWRRYHPISIWMLLCELRSRRVLVLLPLLSRHLLQVLKVDLRVEVALRHGYLDPRNRR